jgi:DNA-binding NtrC family response regulator
MNTHTRRILIVDDDPLQVGLLRRQILRTGIAASVEGHTVAAAALASLAAADAPETLVMLDLNMPDTDGIVFLRRLAEAGFEGGVVLVSGENERIIETAARLAAAYCIDVLGSLVKPVPPSCLQAMLRRWQEGGRNARTASAPRAATPPSSSRGRSRKASCSTTTSPRSICAAAPSQASRPWCAGNIPKTASSSPTPSSPAWRRRG